MSFVLHELLLCCRGLEHEKATERKREVERFRKLIRSQDMVEELDRVSSSRASKAPKHPTWDSVFRSLQRYLQKEIELLQAGKSNVSAATQTSRQKKMQEISSLIKSFVRVANRRGPMLRCAELLAHLLQVLRSPFCQAACCEAYSSLLLKDILSVRKYCCDISPAQWHDLLGLYCGLFNSGCGSVNRVLVIRIISALVQGSAQQTDAPSHSLYGFFSKALCTIRKENQQSVLEPLLCCLNVFLRSVAMGGGRRRACAFGEELLGYVLQVWGQTRPSPTLQEEMVLFCHLQLCLHHPKGAKTPDTGAYAEDWQRWQALLHSLYEALVGEISQIGSRGKYATGSRHIAVRDNLVHLTADLCHQLFDEDECVVAAQRDGPPGRKRRRVVLGWEVVRERLQPHLSDFDIIPWLQIMTSLTSRYPWLPPEAELQPLLALLVQMLEGPARRGGPRAERGPYVLRCLRAMALSRAAAGGGARLWSRVWAVALCGVSSAHTEALSLQLLCALLQRRLVAVDRELWRLFSTACKPSLVAIVCLTEAVCQCPLPSRTPHRPPPVVEGFAPPSLRDAVMGWMFTSSQSEEAEDSKPPLILYSDFPQNLLARVLVPLTLKDSRAGGRALLSSLGANSVLWAEQPEEDRPLADAEMLFLLCSFNEPPGAEGTGSGSGQGAGLWETGDGYCQWACPQDLQLTVLPDLKERLEKRLSSLAEQLLSCYATESVCVPPECVVRCVNLLCGVLAAYVYIGILSEDEASHSTLFLKAKALAQELGEYVSVGRNKLAEELALSTLRAVMRLCAACCSSPEKDPVATVGARLFLRTLPARLLDTLADICRHMLSSSRRESAALLESGEQEEAEQEKGRRQAEGRGHVDLFDDDDDDEGAEESSSGTQVPSADSVEVQNYTGAKSVLAEELLSMPDQTVLAVLDFLCICASEAPPLRAPPLTAPPSGLTFKPSDVRRKLLPLLEMELSKPLFLNMYLVLLKRLPADGAVLPSDECEALLRPLADLCSQYRQDQEVCAAILLGLLPALRQLGGPEPCVGVSQSGHEEGVDEEEDEGGVAHTRGTLLSVLSGFCRLANSGRCVAAVRAALGRCLQVLLEVDPGCEWAVLTVREEKLPVGVALSAQLADAHHHVRMQAALALDRLFVRQSAERKMVPLKQQQEAFENIYLRAQEGMKPPRSCPKEDLPDELYNRRSALLRSISVVMCSSAVCEAQALFALLQTAKENNMELPLIQKVLAGVARCLGYSNVEALLRCHLCQLLQLWLAQRAADDSYSLQAFPHHLLNHDTLLDLYRCCYPDLLPHLVLLGDFEQVRAVGEGLGRDWRVLLEDCFPRILVNILPHFAVPSGTQTTARRDQAHRVYDLLKESQCLGKQRMDALICSRLPDIVVELLMTLYDGGAEGRERSDQQNFTGEWDPAPRPPCFSSDVLRATLDYLCRCHSAGHKTLVAILSKTPMSIQRILLAVSRYSVEAPSVFERHRALLMLRLFVSLLLPEVGEGLGGAWALVLRDIIYTLMHHITSRSECTDEVSGRSLSLCVDLVTSVCRVALQHCEDTLECHLQVIVGTLTMQVTEQSPVYTQVLALLRFLLLESPEQRSLQRAVTRLEPLPDRPCFSQIRLAQRTLRYRKGPYTLTQEIEHFLGARCCSSLPLTRLEGLKDLKRQLHAHKSDIRALLQDCHGTSVLLRLTRNLLQLCRLAVSHPKGRDTLEAVGSCLGELGPVDLSTIALHHGKDEVYAEAAALHPDVHKQWVFIILTSMNNALTHHSIAVKQAAMQGLTDVLATAEGQEFWEFYKSQSDPILVYLSPFRSTRRKDQATGAKPSQDHREALENPALWMAEAGRHQSWLRQLCLALLDSGAVLNQALLLTRPLCQVEADFCLRMLPLFVHSVLLEDSDASWRTLLSAHIQSFFRQYCHQVPPPSRPTTPAPPTQHSTTPSESEMSLASRRLDTPSLRTMLAVLDHLRHQPRPLHTDGQSYGTVCDSNFWLDLNYLEVAQAAQLCSAHFTALLYAEIYVDKMRAGMEARHRESHATHRVAFHTDSQSLTLSTANQMGLEETGISLQELLIEVYRSIGEPDSLYGCGAGQTASSLTRIRTYEHEAMWGQALTSYDLQSSLPEVTRQVGILEALRNLGLSGVLSTYLQGLEREGAELGAELRELRFQAAWRNTQWEAELPERPEQLQPGLNELLFGALQALRDRELSTFRLTLQTARIREVEMVCRSSLEAVSSLYPSLCNLQRITELEAIGPLFFRPETDSALRDVCSVWEEHLVLLGDSSFGVVEPVLALRSSMLQTLLSCHAHSSAGHTHPQIDHTHIRSALSANLLELCRLARTAGNTQLAERAIFQMKQLGVCDEDPVSVSSWQQEEARVFWAKGEQGLALQQLTHIIHTLQEQVDCSPAVVPVYAECLRLCGSWLAESCLESPAVILERFLERAVAVIDSHACGTEAFLSLARFSDAQYQNIDNYMRSSEFENKQALLERARQEVALMRQRQVGNNRYTVKVQRELELDVRALASLKADRRRFLLKAVENYLRCLEQGEEQDTWVFRLASLWLENADASHINQLMQDGVKKISSYKFLPLMYQLAARMGSRVSSPATPEDVGFHDVLSELICHTALDHPHHTLLILLALVNANKDDTFASRGRLSKASTRQPSATDLERAAVAARIISEMRKQRGEMVRDTEALCSAYITLANTDVSRHKTEKKAIRIPVDQPILQMKDLCEVSIPTMEIRVDPSGKYDDLVTLRSFSPHFHLAGGVNLPKIVTCEGSDGRSRRQLVKGQDDLRQDAVMQQVFQMCSKLLQRNTETRKRKLSIRRYKVVPFSQRSGVLEWCSGTVPIGEFLANPQTGAHKRFRPQDWTNLACRKKMMEAQEFDVKLQVFTKVCQNFQPVFRYFCMERFLEPAVWLEKRLAYTRSVATSSIVGYIVGLGDRHIQNILIDEQTAELVHIDLGVAFEQGKILPTPETVPFRLTRDIVDGMGIAGVEGVFRRCCEKTMEVMRSSQEALLTIVEVLLYDPLFDWTMNPLKAFYLQHDEAELNATLNPTPAGEELEIHRKASDSQSFNKVAERVLLRLQEKLKGVEQGAVLSVDGQVNLLIQQSMDPKNLSRLFPGWQAWV